VRQFHFDTSRCLAVPLSYRRVDLVFTHACSSRCVGKVIGNICELCVCLSVYVCPQRRIQKGKRFELSTPYFVDVQCMAYARYVLILGQEVKGQGHTARICTAI